MRALCVLFLLSVIAACASGPRVRRDGADGVNISVMNRTAETVCFLYLSAPAEDTWSDDVLGNGTIAARSRRDVRMPPGQWDLRTENCQHEDTGMLRGARISRGTTLVLQ
ncbi:MAG: hypothetical protein JNK72_19630 [Myxococcales bacterium]|nr:hypothetical protein [Myxococcales bacterium]